MFHLSLRQRLALPAIAAVSALALFAPAAQAEEAAISIPATANGLEFDEDEQFAQAFHARFGGPLTRVVLPVERYGTGHEPFDVRLRAGGPDGEVLAETVVQPADVPVQADSDKWAHSGGRFEVRFPTSVRLERGSKYVVELRNDSRAKYIWAEGPTVAGASNWHRWLDPVGPWGEERPYTMGLDVHVDADGAPAIDIASPVDGAKIPHGADLKAAFTCDDPETGVSACDGTVPNGWPIDTSTLGPKSFTVSASNGDGSRSTKTVTYEVVDVTAPAITIDAPQDGAAYTRGEPRIADFTCTDEAGGSGEASCVGTVAKGAQFATGTLGPKSFTVTARDRAGNERVETIEYSVVDRTPPTIDPESGQQFLIGSEGSLEPKCADEDLGTGLKSCVAQPIDTRVVGFHTALVTATDNAGNETTAEVRYQVIWPFGGFYSPVNLDGTVNLAKAGSAIPVKFSLGGDRGMAVLAGQPTSRAIDCEGGADVDVIEQTTTSAAGLTYDAASGRYQYVWKTQRDWAGTCRKLSVKLADGTTHTALFRLK